MNINTQLRKIQGSEPVLVLRTAENCFFWQCSRTAFLTVSENIGSQESLYQKQSGSAETHRFSHKQETCT